MVAKVALQEFPPMTLAFLRFAFASILLVPFLFAFEKKQFKVKLEDWPKLFAVGFLMISINIALFYQGLLKTSVIDASVLSMTIPILSVIGGWWFLKEKLYWINLLGILLGLLGSIVIIGLPLIFLGNFSSEGLLGNGLIILSCISFVAGTIISKDVLQKYDPLVITFISFLVGAITFFIPASLDYINNPNWVDKISIFGVLALLYITLLSSIVAFFLMHYGVEKVGVIKANLFHYMEPAVAATLAVPILGERISYSFIIGTCLVVLGVYWGTLGKQHHHHINHKHHRS